MKCGRVTVLKDGKSVCPENCADYQKPSKPKRTKPSAELSYACKFLGLKKEKGFIYLYKGHEIDLTECEGEKPIQVLKFVTDILADRLTKVHNGNVAALFGEDKGE